MTEFSDDKDFDMNNDITVLMAVHRGEKTENLHEALLSIHRQTLPPAQIIVVEDGPLSKKLAAEIRQWQRRWKARLLRVRNPKNLGLTASLNRGLEFVTTPLIARMDSDDRSHPKRFERQTKFLSSHPDIAIVGGAIEEFDHNGTRSEPRHSPLTHEEPVCSLHRATPLAHPAVMMRSEIFRSGLRYNERYRTSQDIALWFDAVCAGYRIANLRETVLYFRLNDALYRRRGRQKAWDEFCIYCNGIRRLHGTLSWRYIFPLGRLLSRLMPSPVVRWLYHSPIRKAVVE